MFFITRISLNRGSLCKGPFPTHFIVILAGLKKIVRYTDTEDFVIWRFVKSRCQCSKFEQLLLLLSIKMRIILKEN